MMLMANPVFFVEPQAPKTKSPRRVCDGAILKRSQGGVWPPIPVAAWKPLEGRSIPMWQAVLID